MEYFGILIIGFITIYGFWLIYKACRDEDERSMFGFIKTRTNVLKKYKEEIIIAVWILSLAVMVLFAEVNFCIAMISVVVFFGISIYLIWHKGDFKRIFDKLIE
ncbi:MAG: hypothetical protein WCR63_05180 [Bacilli bacterium]